MVSAPGFVTDLGPTGLAGWTNYIVGILNGTAGEEGVIASATLANNGVVPSVLLDSDPKLLPGVNLVDWPGYPVRAKLAINRSDRELDPFLDWNRARQTVARATCHEEYLEWRTVRQADGKIVRLEFTTETPDYWAKLARYEPRRVLELAARFAGEAVDKIDVRELFGVADPFSVDPNSADGEKLEAVYISQNWARRGAIRGAYNNGVRAMMHMSKPVNSTNAAVALAVYAAYPHGKRVGSSMVALSGPEAIAGTAQAAVNCRNSDPTIVGVTIKNVFSGSKVALMDAIGIYIVSFTTNSLLLDDKPIPRDWISFQRGTFANANPVGVDLFQRLVIEAPPGSSKVVGDLMDANGDRVVSGTQVARLINVGLYLRKTEADAPESSRLIISAPQVPPCPGNDEDVQAFRQLWQDFSHQSGPQPALTAPWRNG